MYAYNEKHLISKAEGGYQQVYEDIKQKEINIEAKFIWKTHTDEIIKADFKINNISGGRTGFKIHKVFFCQKYDRIEVHISRHLDFEDTVEYTCLNQDLTGVVMADKQEVKMMIRLTEDSRTSDESKECIDGGPIVGDKDGSILIGQRP